MKDEASPQISIIMPAIRQSRWLAVYNSILEATSENFELIIASPYSLPKELEGNKDIKLVTDWGSPVRASNIAASLAEAPYITWISDDSLFIKNALDNNFKELKDMGDDYDNVLVAKYSESENFSHKQRFQDDDYYKLNKAYGTTEPFVPNDWWIFNVALMHRSFFEELKAWDCAYETCPIAHADMAIRAQRSGCKVKMSKYPMLMCDHTPNTQGDHAPIHFGQIEHDTPLLYSNITSFKQPLGWRDAPKVWKRRFK
jgi:glycosyltransferase involved in cell wall biosynthesis